MEKSQKTQYSPEFLDNLCVFLRFEHRMSGSGCDRQATGGSTVADVPADI